MEDDGSSAETAGPQAAVPTSTTTDSPSKTETKRTAPTGPKPDKGPRKWLYWLLRHINRPDLVPPLSRSQQEREWMKEIHDAFANGLRMVISVVNIKSGGKTRTALALASILARANPGLRILVAPATDNTATGSIVKMSGVSGRGTTMRLLAQNINNYRSFNSLSQVLLFTLHGVAVVREDINSAVQSGGDYDDQQFMRVARTLYLNADVMVFDHGNDNIQENGIGLAALRMSDVVVVSARYNDPISVDKFSETYRGFQTDLYTGLTAEQISDRKLLPISELPRDGFQALLPGELVSTRDKMRRATLVMACINDYSHDQFDELTRPTEQSATTTPPPVWSGTGVTVRKDGYLAKEGRVAVTDLDKISRGTRRDYTWMTRVVVKDCQVSKTIYRQNMKPIAGRLQRLMDEKTKAERMAQYLLLQQQLGFPNPLIQPDSSTQLPVTGATTAPRNGTTSEGESALRI